MVDFRKVRIPAMHLAGWIIYLLLLTWLLSDFRTFEEALIRGFYIVIVQCIIFYMNYYLLLPRLLEQRQYLLYLLSVVLLTVVALVILYFIDKYLFPREIRSMIDRGFPNELQEGIRQRELPRPSHRVGIRAGLMARRAIIFNGFQILFVLFISTIYRNLVFSRKRDREELQLKNQVLEAESKLLKWQINPHFLFNTLNNIYSMSQLKSDKTPDAIHRLSNMLRYILYDCNEKDVRLEQEISYLKSYIELQRLKDDKLINATYDFAEADTGLRIAPLLFIAFVENSFKHSHIEDIDASWIRITMKSDENRLFFTCENSIPGIPPAKDVTHGIGLDNIRRRLELLYPGRYILNITEEKQVYSIHLTLQLDEAELPDR